MLGVYVLDWLEGLHDPGGDGGVWVFALGENEDSGREVGEEMRGGGAAAKAKLQHKEKMSRNGRDRKEAIISDEEFKDERHGMDRVYSIFKDYSFNFEKPYA
nr:hypothetical protein Iba_chr10aCG3130 [Ipomoea batatas]